MQKALLSRTRLKSDNQIPVVHFKSNPCKCLNLNFKSKGTQTDEDTLCKDHSQQITELLTQVAIALGHKSKLEIQISEMKEDAIKKQNNFNELKMKLEKELYKLKIENHEKHAELTNLKINYLEEHKGLLNQISNLKSEIQNLNNKNDTICQHFKTEKQELEEKINVKTDNLEKETEKNANLQLKLTKYKSKLKIMINYIQNVMHEFKEKKITKENQTDKRSTDTCDVIPNMEELILTELFFKPNPLPAEVEQLFSNQSSV